MPASHYKEIELSPCQKKTYQEIGQQLLRETTTFSKNEIENMIIMPPRVGPYLSRKKSYCRCLVTDKKIEKRQKAVIISTEPIFVGGKDGYAYGHLKRIILAVICDVEAFFHLLDLGSLRALQGEKEDASKKIKPILPHQNVCHCVVCGERIFRPEKMDLFAFGKIFKCENCRTQKKTMAKIRYCRRCGTNFDVSSLPQKSAQSMLTCASCISKRDS